MLINIVRLIFSVHHKLLILAFTWLSPLIFINHETLAGEITSKMKISVDVVDYCHPSISDEFYFEFDSCLESNLSSMGILIENSKITNSPIDLSIFDDSQNIIIIEIIY